MGTVVFLCMHVYVYTNPLCGYVVVLLIWLGMKKHLKDTFRNGPGSGPQRYRFG